MTVVPPPPPSMPPPPPYANPGPAPSSATNGAATAGLILGIVAIFINTFFVVAILGIVFSSIGISNANKMWRAGRYPLGKTAAVWGLVLSILAVLNSLAWKWLVLFLF